LRNIFSLLIFLFLFCTFPLQAYFYWRGDSPTFLLFLFVSQILLVLACLAHVVNDQRKKGLLAAQVAERRADRYQENLNEALRIAKMAYWTYNLEQKQFIASPECLGILRVPKEAELHPTIPSPDDTELRLVNEDFFAMVHPEDLPTVKERWLHAIETETSYELIYRLAPQEGEEDHYIQATAELRKNPEGQKEFIGFIQDITSQQKLTEKLDQARRVLFEVQRVAKVLYNEFDPATEMFFGDEAAAWVQGEGEINYSLADALERMHPDDREREEEGFRLAIKEGTEYESTYRSINPHTQELKYLYAYNWPLLDSRGGVVKYLGFTQDITPHKELEIELRESE